MTIKYFLPILIITYGLINSSCSSAKKLSYLSNLQEGNEVQFFTTEAPDYKIQKRDVLYITLKAMTPDGAINDFLVGSQSSEGAYYMQSESGQYLLGYQVNNDGNITLPVIGSIFVETKTINELKQLLQNEFDKSYKNATVECKLISFKYTVIGEVKSPGTYFNYNSYLTVLEAIGRAGGIGDFGRRDKILIIRSSMGGTKTYTINLQDKNLLSSEAYFMLPNDVIIVEPHGNKIFNLNLPTFSFVLTSITSTISMMILLLNYIK